jgi:glutamate-5-semialdehyde dehydrogenase
MNAHGRGYVRELAERAREAQTRDAALDASERRRLIERMATQLLQQCDAVLAANALDMVRGGESGLAPALLDRLRLDESRLESIAAGLMEVAAQPDPLGGNAPRPAPQWHGDRAPARAAGLIAMIYESRPNVTADAAALC